MSAIWALPRTASLMGESWFGAWIDSLHADALLSRVCPGSEKPVISTVLEMLGPSLDGAVEPVLDRLDRAGLALGFDADRCDVRDVPPALATRFGVPRPDLQDESACDDLLSAVGLRGACRRAGPDDEGAQHTSDHLRHHVAAGVFRGPSAPRPAL